MNVYFFERLYLIQIVLNTVNFTNMFRYWKLFCLQNLCHSNSISPTFKHALAGKKLEFMPNICAAQKRSINLLAQKLPLEA